MELGKYLNAVHEKEPLVQCITNFVTVNDCANIILASGGSPSMAHDKREVAEAVAGADALVCNLGAVEDTEAMIIAGREAVKLGKPVVLDPVAAGGTQLRRDAIEQLLANVHFTAIRGNASEIKAIAGRQATGSGVDVSALDVISDDNLENASAMVKELAAKLGTVIAVSGKIDVVSDGKRVMIGRNGCATMPRITGSGCMLTSLIGAYLGASSKEPFEAVCTAMTEMGVAGELADKKRLKNETGNSTFRNDLIDSVFNMTEKELTEGARYEIY